MARTGFASFPPPRQRVDRSVTRPCRGRNACRHVTGGVTLLGKSITIGECPRSCPTPDFASLTPLFAPRSVAVLGASSDPTRISGRPIAYMKAQGFQGGLYPINPNRTEVQGLKAYPSVADLPETPDVAIVAVAAEHRRAVDRRPGRARREGGA